MNLSLKCARSTQLTLEKTHARSSKSMWSTIRDRLSTCQQRLWCDRRQMDRGTPTSFQSLFSIVWRDISHVMILFSNSAGPLLINMTSLRSHPVLPCIWIRCWYFLIWFCRKHNYILRSTRLHFAFKWPHALILSMKSCGLFPPLHTILTKHQALAPSGPILHCSKFRFFRVEFSLRPSAKAWQEKCGLWVQLLNWSNSESSRFSLLENLSSRGMKDDA